MNQWVKNQYDDVKGNFKWAVLWGCLLVIWEGVKRMLRLIPDMPSWAIWAVLLILAIVAFLIVARWHPKSEVRPSAQMPTGQSVGILGPGIPTLSALTGKSANLNHLTAEAIFGRAYFSPITAEAEKNIKITAHQISPDDREAFYTRLIGVGVVSYMHDMSWFVILKTQLLLLMELNRLAKIVPSAVARPFYEQGNYTNYSFDQWMQWVLNEQLIVKYPTDMIEITYRGNDFLKYIAHRGYDTNAKKV